MQDALRSWINTPGGKMARQIPHVSQQFREYVEADILVSIDDNETEDNT
jgi:hypothetical protein